MLHYTIDDSLKVMCKEHSMHILRNMITLKHCKFNQLSNSLGGKETINPNTLATRLKEMEKSGIIQRKVYDEAPIRIEYHLTKKCAKLLPVLEKMVSYSLKYRKS